MNSHIRNINGRSMMPLSPGWRAEASDPVPPAGEPVTVVARSASIGIAAMTVETVDNHIYFYTGVDTDRVLATIRALKEVDARLRAEQIGRQLPGAEVTPIFLHIHSGGGDLMAAFALADQIKMLATPVVAVIEGLCCSAATVIALACPLRQCVPNSIILIHQFTSWVYGTHEQFKDDMIAQEYIINMLVDFYVEHTFISADRVREYLKRDSWFDPAKALDVGLVDEILLPAPAALPTYLRGNTLQARREAGPNRGRTEAKSYTAARGVLAEVAPTTSGTINWNGSEWVDDNGRQIIYPYAPPPAQQTAVPKVADEIGTLFQLQYEAIVAEAKLIAHEDGHDQEWTELYVAQQLAALRLQAAEAEIEAGSEATGAGHSEADGDADGEG